MQYEDNRFKWGDQEELCKSVCKFFLKSAHVEHFKIKMLRWQRPENVCFFLNKSWIKCFDRELVFVNIYKNNDTPFRSVLLRVENL